MPKTIDKTDIALTIQDHLSPEAVAIIASNLQSFYRSSNESANREVEWFTRELQELLGMGTYNQMLDELSL